MDDAGNQYRKPNPFDKANCFSVQTFGYLLGFFKKGYKKELEEEDLYKIIKSCESKKCGDNIERQWHKTPSLVKTLVYQFGLTYFMVCLITVLWTETNTVLSPLGQSKVIAYFSSNQKKTTRDQVYGYATILVVLSISHSWIMNNIHAWTGVVGVRVQAALKSLLYRKALRLSPAAVGTNLGNIVTLITKDIQIIDNNLWMLRDFSQFFIDFFTVAYLLYSRIGTPGFIGIGLVCMGVPIQIYLSARMKNIRLLVGQNSDERLQRMQETLSAIKVIKMYTWEKFFLNRISESRKKEINTLLKLFMINVFIESIGFIISKVSFVLLIMIYVWMGYQTSTELIFYILQLFNHMSSSFGSVLPANFTKSAQFYASVVRLNKVLQAEELVKFDNEFAEMPVVFVKNVLFEMENREILRNVSMSITYPGLNVVTGSVGSGKSSLLKIILRDYQPLKEGFVEVSGSISYASQDPWIFPATVRQNILFGEEYDKARYDEVVRVCALQYDFALLEQGDQTVLSDRGQNLSKGQQARINLARAIYRDTNIYLLDDPLTALDTHVQDYIFKECILKFLKDKIVILVSQNSRHMDKANKVFIMNDGKLIYDDFDKDSLEDISGKTEIFKKHMNSKNSIKAEELAKRISSKDLAKRKSSKKDQMKLSQVEQQQRRKSVYREVKKQGVVDLAVYKRYFSYGGGVLVFFLIMLVYIGTQFCESYGDELLTKWVDYQEDVRTLERKHRTNDTNYQNALHDRDFTFTMLGIMTILRSILGVGKVFALLWFCRTASINLHKKMTIAIIGATMAFFDTHFVGNILNRLSYDLNNIDEVVPFQFPSFGSTLFHCGGAVVLVASVNWFFLIPAAVFVCILLVLRSGYIRGARSIKRLEAATRSPLVGHINSSLEGLTTIRAFNAEENLMDEFDRHQNLYSSAFLIQRMAAHGFSFYMDMMSSLLTIIVIGRFLFFEHSSSAGDVGLALTQVFKLTSYVESAVKQWATVENSMTSVERAVEYTNLDQEFTEGKEVESWPSKGSIRFEKVSLCYEGCKIPILKGINFEVKPREKVGIVGRTGAGKSSVITVLYRLYEHEGTVDIDGVDTKILNLEFLRKHISIIPQDPVLFTGTIRENIDPHNMYPDDVIWEVIQRVGLKEMVPSLEKIIEDSGSHYSSGQKQLICLARAAIAKCKIVVLDEATANMDAETDKMLHDIVYDVFSDCTILMIAHRMHLILKCDKVLVLDKGNVVEFDDPKTLLNNSDSLFHKMCQESKMD